MERRLDREPRLSAKTLWEELLREHGEKFRAGQRRSFKRRVRGRWKDHYGCEPGAVFRAGAPCRGAPANRLGGLQRAGSAHWQRSFLPQACACGVAVFELGMGAGVPQRVVLSLRDRAAKPAWELGGVPQICQSDNSSTATHELGRGRPGRGYNARYLSLLAYYGMRTRTDRSG